LSWGILESLRGRYETMKREILELYRRGAPELTEDERGYLRGLCPFCGEDGFMAGGLISTSTGEETNDFLCLDCDREGGPEELVEALEELQARGPTAEGTEPPWISGLSQYESVDGQGFEEQNPGPMEEGTAGIEEEEPEYPGSEDEIFSLTRKRMRKLLDLAKEDHPSQVYRLVIWLTFLGKGLTAKQLSVLTRIPLSSVYRTLKGNGLFYFTGNPARFYANLDDSHSRENNNELDSRGRENTGE